ncbi:MAG TPA: biopolymer transporter ExbD [Alphaproteobacteria bacterium]|nr:biopolymer transporter ExbD [Alphaproteobacteria bacterium]
MEFRRIRRSRPGLDLTPLVDTVLNLLIFFMLSSSFAFQPGIRVRLPEAASKEEEPQRDLVLVLTRDQRLYLNDDPIQLTELGTRLHEHLRARNDAVVIIKADRDVIHGRVVEVMDIAKEAGVTRLAIATEPKTLDTDRER